MIPEQAEGFNQTNYLSLAPETGMSFNKPTRVIYRRNTTGIECDVQFEKGLSIVVNPREPGKSFDMLLPSVELPSSVRNPECIEIGGLRTIQPRSFSPTWSSLATKINENIENNLHPMQFSQERISIPLDFVDDRIVVGSNVKLCVGELQSGMRGGMEINGQVLQRLDDRIIIEPSNPDIAKNIPSITAVGN